MNRHTGRSRRTRTTLVLVALLLVGGCGTGSGQDGGAASGAGAGPTTAATTAATTGATTAATTGATTGAPTSPATSGAAAVPDDAQPVVAPAGGRKQLCRWARPYLQAGFVKKGTLKADGYKENPAVTPYMRLVCYENWRVDKGGRGGWSVQLTRGKGFDASLCRKHADNGDATDPAVFFDLAGGGLGFTQRWRANGTLSGGACVPGYDLTMHLEGRYTTTPERLQEVLVAAAGALS